MQNENFSPEDSLEPTARRQLQATHSRKKHVSMGLQPKASPVDFSWKEMKTLEVILAGKVDPTNFKGGQKKPTRKDTNTTLMVGSNELTTLALLPKVVDTLFMGAAKLLWLDVSHNSLTAIEPVLLQFPNLQILYMHGNEIAKLKEVNKLRELQHLRKLTLHANPIEEVKNYRLHVFTQIPHIRMLDFIDCTRVDRDKANTWDALKFKPKD